MKKIGLIMEINPFHNGHKYFLEQVRLQEPDSFIICIITTTLTQRAEVSVLNKEIKTQILLENGVDLILELPHVLSCQGGEYYGYHNIRILNEFGIDKIYFGSESADIKKINEQILKSKHNKDFEKGYLKAKIGQLKSNDILAMSYIKAINKINKNIKYDIIKRINNNYNDQSINLENQVKICSATTIRNNMNKQYIKEYLPKLSFDNLLYFDENKLVDLLFFQLLNNSNDNIFLSQKGQIINKINKKLQQLKAFENIHKYSLDELAKLCSDKNNSQYKIKRIFINIIFQINEEEILKSIEQNTKYKVLGFSKRAQKEIKSNKKIFLSYKSKDVLYEYNDKIDKILSLYLKVNFNLNYNKPVIC